jgi:hypothetical protein
VCMFAGRSSTTQFSSNFDVVVQRMF